MHARLCVIVTAQLLCVMIWPQDILFLNLWVFSVRDHHKDSTAVLVCCTCHRETIVLKHMLCVLCKAILAQLSFLMQWYAALLHILECWNTCCAAGGFQLICFFYTAVFLFVHEVWHLKLCPDAISIGVALRNSDISDPMLPLGNLTARAECATIIRQDYRGRGGCILRWAAATLVKSENWTVNSTGNLAPHCKQKVRSTLAHSISWGISCCLGHIILIVHSVLTLIFDDFVSFPSPRIGAKF
jgi:hypothetical protein